MKEESTYRWRIKWAGRWTTTNYQCTEEHIRKEHPEAVRIDNTLLVRRLPETEVEKARARLATETSYLPPARVAAMLKDAEKRDAAARDGTTEPPAA
jgi:hypothetical protein